MSTKAQISALLQNRIFIGAVGVTVLLVAFYFLFWRKRRGSTGGLIRRTDLEPGYFENLESALQEMEAAGAPATFPDFNYVDFANTIYRALRFSAVSDNKAQAADVLKQMQTDYDILKLDLAFGQRQEYLFGIPNGGRQSLSQMVSSNLKRKTIDAINADYAAKGMKYRF